jgi:hypothetical protein
VQWVEEDWRLELTFWRAPEEYQKVTLGHVAVVYYYPLPGYAEKMIDGGKTLRLLAQNQLIRV